MMAAALDEKVEMQLSFHAIQFRRQLCYRPESGIETLRCAPISAVSAR
tara:strand:- start:344 stop:487 length:144 start_codon:yes stop_codon:yes gene_type:complete